VIGYDNDGRSRGVAGALVRMAAATALTDGDGRASVVAPAAGRVTLWAERARDVPSFPERITVR
jgi:hypothetical protein